MMNACKSALLIILLLVSIAASANEKKLALVRKIQGLELIPESLSRQLQTITLLVITKQPDYELLLSGKDTPTGSVVEIVAVESEVSKSAEGYRIETRLLDLRTKKLITKAERDGIREEDLVRLFQGALESLFIPDKEIEKPSEEKEQKPKTPNVTTKIQQPKPPTTQISKPDPPQMNFKERVRELQRAADRAITKRVEEKEKIAEAAKSAAKPPVQTPPQQSQPSKMMSSVAEQKVEKKPLIEKMYPKSYDILVGHDSRQIDTEFYLGTSVKAQLLTLKAMGDYPFPVLDGKLGGSFDLGYSRPLSVPVEIAGLYQAGAYLSWLSPRWKTSVGMHRDSSFFVNLPEAGASLQPQTINSTWMKFKTSVTFDVWGPWKLNFAYGVPNSVQTSYAPLKNAKSWQGSSMQFGITPPLSVLGIETHFAIEQINLTSSGELPFTLNESRIALSVRRSL